MTSAVEYNFDGLVGLTHNYAGLSVGNVASLKNAQGSANPKEAALQGLIKMKALQDMGLPQAVLAPMERPDIATLRRLGFCGDDAKVLREAAIKAPQLLVACSSASSMWTANACTVSPSADTKDSRLHITPANLASKFHRSIEFETTARILKAMFKDEKHFAHHQALPLGEYFGDEGAANHTRFCDQYGDQGLEFFVFGKYAFKQSMPEPQMFPARQTFEASEALVRLHQLPEQHTVIAQQNPDVIDAGVFHNDVIAVGNGNVLFCHEMAFLDQKQTLESLRDKYPGESLEIIEVTSEQVPLEDAVSSYLFNSQLVNHPEGGMMLISPAECQANPRVRDYLQRLVETDNSISDVQIFEVQQSMRNGGGPACLRQRIVLTDPERMAANSAAFMNDELFSTLNSWVNTYYRDRMSAVDLADPQLLIENRTALDQLTKLLNLGSVYPFQLI
ncbi:MAG: N-succinylarginine dihydrolase [Gammaproteobacteria bacterium]|nr:MAG: N-succinylarginine dihydrolase [Gammaproteobacteria bacterium]